MRFCPGPAPRPRVWAWQCRHAQGFRTGERPFLPTGGGNRPADLGDALQAFQDNVEASRTLIAVGTSKKVWGSAPVPTREGDRFFLDYIRGTGGGQPIFHIDMFITLVGRDGNGRFRVMVGSPRRAAEIANRPFHPGLAMQAAFDDIADLLEARGFEVIRNPLPQVHTAGAAHPLSMIREHARSFPRGDERTAWTAIVDELTALGAGDDTLVESRRWYFATANNCLVQTAADGGNVVLLPTYGHAPFDWLRAVDAEMRRLWTDLGYEVRELANFHPFAESLGAVHCIKKYLERSEGGVAARLQASG